MDNERKRTFNDISYFVIRSYCGGFSHSSLNFG